MTENEIIAERVKWMSKDPALFVKYAMRTKDEADPNCFEPKPFCFEKPYIQDIIELWKRSEQTFETIAIEKSRQMRVSWIFGGLHLHYAFTKNYRNVLVLSKTEKDAISLLDRIEFIYKSIPTDIWPRHLLPDYDRVKTEIVFYDSNNTKTRTFESKIISLTSSPDAARSNTASRIWLDEFAFMEEALQVYSAAVGSASGAAVGAGIPMVLTSTNPILKNVSDHPHWQLIDDRPLEEALQ